MKSITDEEPLIIWYQGLKRVLLDLSSSCINEDSIQDDITLESQLQGAESYPNYPGR